jgi:hypothetical protein
MNILKIVENPSDVSLRVTEELTLLTVFIEIKPKLSINNNQTYYSTCM